MRLSIKTLDIFFRRIEPEEVIRGVMSGRYDAGRMAYRELFQAQAETTLGGYSSNEQDNIFQYYHQRYERFTSEKYAPPFYLLVDYANDVLEEGKDGPSCRYEKVLNWRDAFLLMGQDIFTTAWLANLPKGSRAPLRFSWPATIPVNNRILDSITDGVAENHLHFYAGASTFSLTWCCMMNHPDTFLKNGQGLEKLLCMHQSRSAQGNLWSVRRRLIYVAYIRALLFAELKGDVGHIMQPFRVFHCGYRTDGMEYSFVGRYAQALRILYGLKFPQPDGRLPVCMDYAFSGELSGELEEHSRLMASERRFLYLCFKRCFERTFTIDEQWLFYIYLLIKLQIRSEFIQANRQTGFHNFREYDQRKYLLWKDFPEYWNEDYRQALNASFQEEKLSSFEGRLTPKTVASKTIRTVHSIDRAKLYYDTKNFSKRWRIIQWRPSFSMVNQVGDAPYYFAMHFPKAKDKPLLNQNTKPLCRHADLRDKVRLESIQLAIALSNCDYLCERIRGIDACSNEIGCRPEVFATAFRFLRSFPVAYYRRSYSAQKVPRISATYHVGEDFLDIADGLRAMDEAIHFLGLRRGDRFGHALALGVDPELHYERKHHQIILNKQDLLDNLIWLIHRSVALNVEMPTYKLKEHLCSLANQLFGEIYSPYLSKNTTYTLEDYYQSMQLRGDVPSDYIFGVRIPSPITDPFDLFGENDSSLLYARLQYYRKQKKLAELYCCYHYCFSAKKAGEALTTMEITPEYIELISRMQEAMRRFINSYGISIECNPSSNVLIGTFERYEKHPILTFNNEKLNYPRQGVQMHVSINSDDPGVFDTTLRFEYALLARALGEMTTASGERQHSDREIESYLRNIARMGREQSFPKA